MTSNLPGGKVDLKLFTLETYVFYSIIIYRSSSIYHLFALSAYLLFFYIAFSYQLIVKYKTAYYSFYLPVALAMMLAGITSPPTFQTAADIVRIKFPSIFLKLMSLFSLSSLSLYPPYLFHSYYLWVSSSKFKTISWTVMEIPK